MLWDAEDTKKKTSGRWYPEASQIVAFCFEISLSLYHYLKSLFSLQILTCAVHATVGSRRECVSGPSPVRWPSLNAAVPIRTMVLENPASHALLKIQVDTLPIPYLKRNLSNLTSDSWSKSTSPLKCFVYLYWKERNPNLSCYVRHIVRSGLYLLMISREREHIVNRKIYLMVQLWPLNQNLYMNTLASKSFISHHSEDK